MATSLLVLILGNLMISPEKPTGPSLIVPKSTEAMSNPANFLAWVGTSARGRMEVLFIEQKSLREQLTEILQEVDDYTWTEDGLANFSIKILVKELAWKLHTASFRRYERSLQKLQRSGKPKDSIWLPNFFEGKDPFDGKQVDEKGLPAGGQDKRGATVLPKTKQTVEEPETEF